MYIYIYICYKYNLYIYIYISIKQDVSNLIPSKYLNEFAP